MSNSPDPQTWIFPPLGAADLPSDVSASFGPISQGDKIKLEWAPASSTPEIAFICANDGTTYGISDGSNTSPFTYTFSQTINNGSSHMCWFFFPGTTLGNTLTFDYDNDGTGSSVLWEQDSQLAQALSGGNTGGGSASTIISTVTVTKTAKALDGAGTASGLAAAATTITLTETETITQAPSTLLTTIANPSTTFVSTSVELLAQGTPAAAASTSPAGVGYAQPSGLSAGAAAGITAAAVIVFALLLLLGWILYSRRNRNHAQDGGVGTAGMVGAGPGVDRGPVVVPETYKYQPPMQQQEPLMQSYYQPASVSAPRRTIHEIGD